jgi:hypothetical protein
MSYSEIKAITFSPVSISPGGVDDRQVPWSGIHWKPTRDLRSARIINRKQQVQKSVWVNKTGEQGSSDIYQSKPSLALTSFTSSGCWALTKRMDPNEQKQSVQVHYLENY